MKPGIGDSFQQETKYHRGHLRGGGPDWASKPASYKQYPSAPKIPLGPPQTEGGAPIWDVLQQRQSIRRFQDAPLQREELSQLLWAAQGITRTGRSFGLRTAPSASALYPVETYAVVHTVEGIEPGVYHYAVEQHELDQLKTGDFRKDVARAALDQDIAYWANVVFVWTAIFDQNVALGAVALGLGSCQVAALYDDEANVLLGVDGVEESTIYMTAVGRPR
jgi:nitroreductase